MNIINTTIINLDINKTKYDKIQAKQGDTKSRFLLFNLLDSGIPFNLTERNVRAYAIKPDGKKIFNDLTVIDENKGICMLELTTQILIKPGIVKMELVITEGLKKLSSMQFELEVIESLNNEEAIESTNEFSALVNALASLSEYEEYKNEVKNTSEEVVNLKNEIKDARGSEDNLNNRLDRVDTDLKAKMDKTKGGPENPFDDIHIIGVDSVKSAIEGRMKSESGNWTCVLYNGTNGYTPAYKDNGSYYIKIGNAVMCYFDVTVTEFDSSWNGASMLLKGLPFTPTRTKAFLGQVTGYKGFKTDGTLGVGLSPHASSPVFWVTRKTTSETDAGLNWGTHCNNGLKLTGIINFYI